MKPHNILITILLTITLQPAARPPYNDLIKLRLRRSRRTSSPAETSVTDIVTFADPVLEAMIRGGNGQTEGEITIVKPRASPVKRISPTPLQRQLS